MSKKSLTIYGTVVRGHQVTSKRSKHYPHGSIEIQIPFFRQLGLDLTPYYRGTLNVSISPDTFIMKDPPYAFRNVKWTSINPPEDFSFSRCRVNFESIKHDGWIYYPYPETKIRYFHNPSIIEIVALHIPSIKYGDPVGIEVDAKEVLMNKSEASDHSTH